MAVSLVILSLLDYPINVMRRSTLTITLVLVTSPLVLAGCGRSSDDANGPHGSGGGFHGVGSFHSGGGGVSGHASPGGGFGGFGHAGGAHG